MLPRNLNVGVPTHTTARKWKNEAQNRYVVRTIYLAIVYLRPQINLFDFTTHIQISAIRVMWGLQARHSYPCYPDSAL